MVHRDSLGNEAGISDGEVQWMNSGSGIMHEEMVPAAERLLGVQLWLNLPAKDKMSKPSYNSIKNEDIKEIEIEGGKIRLLAGKYGEHEGYKGDYLSMDYYDIHLNADAEVTLTMEEDDVKYTIDECKERDATYAAPLKVRVRLHISNNCFGSLI